MSTAIVWFRNDLRLHDHEALSKASENHDQVIPFYCFEEKQFEKTAFGFEKTGSFRAQFLIESVANLRKNLQALGSDLVVRTGNTAVEIGGLATKVKAEVIYAFKAIHDEEIQIQQSVENNFVGELNYSFGSTLFHVNDLPHAFEDTPKVFTDFRKGVEKNLK